MIPTHASLPLFEIHRMLGDILVVKKPNDKRTHIYNVVTLSPESTAASRA